VAPKSRVSIAVKLHHGRSLTSPKKSIRALCAIRSLGGPRPNSMFQCRIKKAPAAQVSEKQFCQSLTCWKQLHPNSHVFGAAGDGDRFFLVYM